MFTVRSLYSKEHTSEVELKDVDRLLPVREAIPSWQAVEVWTCLCLKFSPGISLILYMCLWTRRVKCKLNRNLGRSLFFDMSTYQTKVKCFAQLHDSGDLRSRKDRLPDVFAANQTKKIQKVRSSMPELLGVKFACQG